MSPYAEELAHARVKALRTLIDALNEADSPEEKRRCAVAIFDAPDPCDLDDEIELVDDDEDENEAEIDDENDGDEESEDVEDDTTDDLEDDQTNNSEPAATPQPEARSSVGPSAGQCDGATTPPDHSSPPALHDSPLPHAPTIFLPAPSGPPARIIAAAGRSP